MRILAFDPGPHTGYAEYTVETDGETNFRAEQWAESFIDGCWSCFARIDGGADAVVIEDFFIGGTRGRESNFTIETIGAIKWMAGADQIPVFMQSPSDSVKFVTKEKLDTMGWKPVGSHARSASRHLLLYLVRAGYVAGADVLR